MVTDMNSTPFQPSQQVQQAYNFFLEGNYAEAAYLYEQLVEADPSCKSNYWYLGLAQLLNGSEEEAQVAWWLAAANGESEEAVDQGAAELTVILQTEAQRCEESENPQAAWLIRKHLKEINPADIDNALHLVRLSIKTESSVEEDLEHSGLLELLGTSASSEADPILLLETLEQLLEAIPFSPLVFRLAQLCSRRVQPPEILIRILIPAALRIGYVLTKPGMAIELLELCLPLIDSEAVENRWKVEPLYHLAALSEKVRDYPKAITVVERCLALSQEIDQVFANRLLLYILMSTGGSWERVYSIFEQHLSMLTKVIEDQPMGLRLGHVSRLFTANYEFFFIRDDIQTSRTLQNSLAAICQNNIDTTDEYQPPFDRTRPRQSVGVPSSGDGVIKIGYLSSCLKSHSVGWLARWLIQHHDREKFTTYGYQIPTLLRPDDPLRQWYVNQFDEYCIAEGSPAEIAQKIYDDGIDILIDLDSITLDQTCEVVALKPAPVQATWLGWDASGLPSVDYFIADPYVLPEEAEDYYSETIWRLPQTYLAVDGFEIGVPTLRRDPIDIPNDAVIFFSAQRGNKRHPDTVRLQLKILKEVPNSYFLIKGISDESLVQEFFKQLAEEEGVGSDRLRFLQRDSSELVHRANLGIADVVLDTYPYNGATTTMETLWMGIPLVTKVGQQFAARNSYTMMVNAGLTEGIAWTDEEYVEWGIRLGRDASLRQKITWQLKQARYTARLWDAQRFTREMEDAYRQMWALHLESQR